MSLEWQNGYGEIQRMKNPLNKSKNEEEKILDTNHGIRKKRNEQ